MATHIVLVHGACHGAWCWYKVKPLLEAAGHRVTAIDLAASGVDRRHLEELRSIEEYTQPLLELLESIPAEEKVVLVGHSLGGFSLAVAMDTWPHKISTAVFLTAFMPDSDHKPSYVSEKYVETTPTEAWLDTEFKPYSTSARADETLTSMFFGPKFIDNKLYHLCSIEDTTLAKMLLRPSSLFIEDMSKKTPFSKEKFGSVKRVFVVCCEDRAIPVDFQRWMIETIGADQVKEMVDSDHMPMLCNPLQLSQVLTEIAEHYA